MAINDYATLKAAVIDFAGRDDLSARFDSFLALAESTMFNNDVIDNITDGRWYKCSRFTY